MAHIHTRNVNSAFRTLVEGTHLGTIPTTLQASRVGEVLVIEEPVTITYERPLERVLFSAARDANPFMHLYESLWMLAGRNDIAPVAYYSSNYAKQVQDGGSLYANGAYGYRWRHATKLIAAEEETQFNEVVETLERSDVDQLKILIDHLRRNPYSRRAVLSMWNVEDDLLKIDTSKDVCCNLSIHFMVRQGVCEYCNAQVVVGPGGDEFTTCPKCGGKPHDVPRYLDITVFNRSNDLIWGALGANVVHFSFLQEYMAAHLGLEVGVYNQISNNLHVYTSNWKPEEWLRDYHPACYTDNLASKTIGHCKPFPLVSDPAVFDKEVGEFVERHSKDALAKSYAEPFLNCVAQPMCVAFHYAKRKEYETALMVADSIAADDWRIAARGWIERREKRAASKIQA